MTGELRVVVTGVQVLFAFLLIVPFNTGFAHVGDFERTVYFITLLLAALAAVCTIAPSAAAPLSVPPRRQAPLVFYSNRVVIAGLVFLALAMCGCLLLVTTKLFGVVAGGVTAALGRCRLCCCGSSCHYDGGCFSATPYPRTIATKASVRALLGWGVVRASQVGLFGTAHPPHYAVSVTPRISVEVGKVFLLWLF